MTLEEYLDRYMTETNQLLRLLGREVITADNLRDVGIRVIRCECGGRVCDGWQLTLGEVQH